MKTIVAISILVLTSCASPRTQVPDDGLVPPAPQMTFVDESVGQSASDLIKIYGKPTLVRDLVIIDSQMVGPLKFLIGKEKQWEAHGGHVKELIWESKEWRIVAWFIGDKACFASLRYKYKSVEL